jgi:hypothetical protein
MQTDSQLIASRKTVKDNQPLNLTKEIKSPQANATNNSSTPAELRRKWGIETTAFRLVHARKF